jgi:hypothetical protein
MAVFYLTIGFPLHFQDHGSRTGVLCQMVGIFDLSPWIVRRKSNAADLAVGEADIVELVADCYAVLTDSVAPAHTTEPFPAVAELSDNVDQIDDIVVVAAAAVEGVPECAVLTDMVVV